MSSESLMNMAIPLIVVVAVAVIAFVVVRFVMRTARDAASAVSSVSNILKEVEAAQYEEQTRPKSLAATTSLTIPLIKKDFPEFNVDEMRQRAANCITQYLRAIDQMDASLLKACTPELRDALKLKISMLRDEHLSEQYDQIKVHRTEISRYEKRNGRCIVTFQCSLQSKHVVYDANGTVLKGSADKWEQTRWQADLLYVQDASMVQEVGEAQLGLSCPNCGAPVQRLGQKTCDYCGTGIVEINLHAWNFAAVEEI